MRGDEPPHFKGRARQGSRGKVPCFLGFSVYSRRARVRPTPGRWRWRDVGLAGCRLHAAARARRDRPRPSDPRAAMRPRKAARTLEPRLSSVRENFFSSSEGEPAADLVADPGRAPTRPSVHSRTSREQNAYGAADDALSPAHQCWLFHELSRDPCLRTLDRWHRTPARSRWHRHCGVGGGCGLFPPRARQRRTGTPKRG